MAVLRAVGDGPLFEMPGGAARLAIGVEYQDNQAESRVNTGRVGSIDSVPFRSYSRESYSAFAELNLPVTEFLDISASARYDEYSDFGSTTNPSLGFNLHPVDGLRVYGHWGTSFNAPTAYDGLGFATGRFACGIYTLGLGSASRPFDPPPAQDNGQGTCAMVLDGVKAGIRPQTSDNWAFGIDAEPMEGLRIGGQFYSIDFADVLGAVNPQDLNTYTTNPELYLYAVTAPQYAAINAQLINGATLAAQQPSSNIAIVVDRRVSNLGSALLEGIDFHVYYDRPLGGAELSLGLAGTLTTTSQANFGRETNELGNGFPELVFTTFAGVDFGAFSTRVTANYSGEFTSTSPSNLATNDFQKVDPFTMVNLNFGYEFDDSASFLSGTQLRLAVNNVFEETPQRMRRGSANILTYENWSLGREIRVGFSKTF
jgi:iron complex outermembrane receptor protein